MKLKYKFWNLFNSIIFILISSFYITTNSFAQTNSSILIYVRCEEDSLSLEQAIIRIKWAYKCKDQLQLKNLPNNPAGSYFDINIKDEESFVKSDKLVNGIDSYLTYPTFTTEDLKNPKRFFAPGHALSKTNKCWLPEGYGHYVSCTAGCFKSDQLILTNEGYKSIQSLYNKNNVVIVGLSPKATLNELNYQHYIASNFIRSIEDTKQPLVRIETALGGSLVVTLNHPMLLASGYMIKAEKLKVGDSLLRIDGTKDVITNIKKVEFFGKVINLRTDQNNWYSNIIVSQGFLTGSHWYQMRQLDLVNRVLFRTTWIQEQGF